MYETNKQISSYTSFLENLSSNTIGLGQNITRFKSVPHDVSSGDVKRCENTISNLEQKIQEGRKLIKNLQDSKKSCYSSSLDIVPAGKKKLHYIEEKIGVVEKCINQFTAMASNTNEVYSLLCKRFSNKSAIKSDKARQKRRKKEQRKKCAKKKRKTLKKHMRNLVSKILTSALSKFSLEQEGNKPLVTRSNLNYNALNTDIIKPRFHLQPLKN